MFSIIKELIMDIKDLKKLAELSKLEYSDEELMGLSESFESMKSLIDIVKNANIDGERKLDTIDMADLREDVVQDSESAEVLLMNAPQSAKDSYIVPRIVE